MDPARFQAQEILDGLALAQREMDAGRSEAVALATGRRLIRRRFRPEMKDEATARFDGAWATLRGERVA